MNERHRLTVMIHTLLAAGALSFATGATALPTVQQRLSNVELYGATPADARDDRSAAVVALSATQLALLAPGDDGGNGSVRMYERLGSTWTYRTTIALPPTAGGGTMSLALNERYLIVGAPQAPGGGVVLVYTRNGTNWSAPATLFPETVEIDDRFGASVAIDAASDLLVVGAPLADTVEVDGGAAYVFTRTAGGFIERQRLSGTLAVAAGDRFGTAVATSGGTVAVSAPYSRPQTIGEIAIYDDNGATLVRTATLDTSFGFGHWGKGLGISGDTVVVGDPLISDLGQFSPEHGAVAFFVRNAGGTWDSQLAHLPFDEDRPNWHVGETVAIAGDRAVAGSGNGSGVFVYRRTAGTWVVETYIDGIPAAPPGSGFGHSVAIDIQHVVVGADLFDERSLADTGAALILGEPASVPDIDVLGPDSPTPLPPGATIEIADVLGGAATTRVLTIRNVGTATLQAIGVDSLDAPLSAALAASSVTAGSSTTLTLSCNAVAGMQPSTQTLRVASNDPDEPFVVYTVRCTSAGTDTMFSDGFEG
jgi:hypothetical protein